MRGPETGRAGEVPNLVDEPVFRLLLNLEVQKATRLHYCVGVVVMAIDAETSREPAAYQALVRYVAEMAARQLRATDAVATLSPSSIGLLLIDAETAVLPRILSRAVQPWEHGRLNVEGRDWWVHWNAGGGSYPSTATTANGLLRQATDLVDRAREEGGDRLCLPA